MEHTPMYYYFSVLNDRLVRGSDSICSLPGELASHTYIIGFG
jgi:hypothetical protein